MEKIRTVVRALLDTNVVLDLVLKRSPWAEEAGHLFAAIERGGLFGCVSASALTDVFYISRKLVGSAVARSAVRRCLDSFTIITVDSTLVLKALSSPIDDLEDALQVAYAVQSGLDFIVTRDTRGFVGSPITACSPTELLVYLSKLQTPSP